MEEILKKIDELNDFLSAEQLEKMTPQERTEYLEMVEKIKTKIDTLIEIEEGGNE